MIIQKIFDTCLSIENQDDYEDIEKFIINAVKQLEGTCYRGTFIKSIIGIEKHSKAYMELGSNYGNGYVNIKFRAECIDVTRGELFMLTLVQKDEFYSLQNGIYRGIIKRVPENIKSFPINTILPFIVEESSYPTRDKQIVLFGKIFSIGGDKNPTVHFIKSDKLITESYEKEINILKKLQEEIKTIDSKDVLDIFPENTYKTKKNLLEEDIAVGESVVYKWFTQNLSPVVDLTKDGDKIAFKSDDPKRWILEKHIIFLNIYLGLCKLFGTINKDQQILIKKIILE
jgi:hypothetical protein